MTVNLDTETTEELGVEIVRLRGQILRLRAAVESARVLAIAYGARAGERFFETLLFETGPMVHVLWNGRVLCGMPLFPSNWQEGHRWVRREEVADATCPECKAGAARAAEE